MKLTEIFDKQFDFDWDYNTDRGDVAFTRLDNNSMLKVFFEDLTNNQIGIAFSLNNRFSTTYNNKDQFLIFSAVYQAIKDYFHYNHDIDSIYFSAEEGSKVKLYRKFIDRYASKFGFKLKEEYKSFNSAFIRFILEKI